MWDDKYSAPRLVWGFYSLEDLEYEMFKHKNKRSLSSVEIDISISGRSYQIEGIKSVYEKFEKGYRKSLGSNGYRMWKNKNCNIFSKRDDSNLTMLKEYYF